MLRSRRRKALETQERSTGEGRYAYRAWNLRIFDDHIIHKKLIASLEREGFVFLYVFLQGIVFFVTLRYGKKTQWFMLGDSRFLPQIPYGRTVYSPKLT